ncbi:MAG: alpha-amylase family glycosyl hydrolase [Chloroherpetonaceae bacterium]|nr:alpha-amylase family glycosyl hydrolase [Chloroherpetonaceae bacterium]MDW8019185.1 alpha-amylase family glycosyl hydrolase [Chloroherpetonaceae bacterium]MDW8465655.1 alpha-amylase family glycosyl hydrolase [Chloroherpetonaceae bacterium]
MALEKLLVALQALPRYDQPYFLPTLWHKGTLGKEAVEPRQYYTTLIERLLATPKVARPQTENGEWTRDAVIYNLFVRTATAFDHNQNGQLDLETPNAFRETGTFLKSIALLPYLQRLGVSVVHLLPITAIGSDGNKGNLGSPYAIKNPYKLDERLSEPILGLTVEDEFKAFVEAAHRLGLRVVVEFVFRTAAKDSDWIPEHPDWFYWIDAAVPDRPAGSNDETCYGNPIFTATELKRIAEKVERGDFHNLPEPSPTYRAFFTETPYKVEKQNGQYRGLTSSQRLCRIPGAFADWPPQDTQPPWNDVTYLRLYTHPRYNYIAYNTIRMYEANLAKPEYINQPLWDKIIGIIPYYQDAFGIDGVMIDMGHALPSDLKKSMVNAARAKNPDFAFWDENFAATAKSRKEGYNAVIGSLPFVMHKPAELHKMLRQWAQSGVVIPCFATAESHNTPRAAARFGNAIYGRNFAKFAFALSAFLPAIPFIHNGAEICETYPINTGLDFSPEELKHYPSHRLPLFSAFAFDWENGNGQEPLVEFIATVLQVRQRYLSVITQHRAQSFKLLSDERSPILVFTRQAGHIELLYVGNMNVRGAEQIRIPLRTAQASLKDLLSGHCFPVESGLLSVELQAGESALFEIS